VTSFLKYLRYWVFIGTNWNFPLAFFTILHEIRGEKKYQVDTIRLDRLHHLQVTGDNRQHASIYQACNYYVLEKGFDFMTARGIREPLVDFGCGKGRVLAVAARYGFTEITGVEFSPALCALAEKNLDVVRPIYPGARFTVVCEDATRYHIGPRERVFFFFNPFDEVVLLAVVKNLLASLREHPRQVYVLYANAVHRDVLLSAGFEELFQFRKMTYLEMTIFTMNPGEDPVDRE